MIVEPAKEHTPESILDEAIKVMAEKGFPGLTYTEVNASYAKWFLTLPESFIAQLTNDNAKTPANEAFDWLDRWLEEQGLWLETDADGAGEMSSECFITVLPPEDRNGNGGEDPGYSNLKHYDL
jgi:hypothetical protein